MSTSFPPPTPPPPRRNDTWLAVIIGILIVLVIIVGFGVFVIARFVGHTHIRTTGSGAGQVTTIESPLGNVHVDGDGNNARVSVESPFGDVKIVPTPDLSRLDMTVFPGASEVTANESSAFDSNGSRWSHLGIAGSVHVGRPDAEVTIQSGDHSLVINMAEFRTTASMADVLAYYQKRLGRFGAVEHRWDGDEQSLKVKLSSSDVRAVAVRQGSGGTHFALIRVENDNFTR